MHQHRLLNQLINERLQRFVAHHGVDPLLYQGRKSTREIRLHLFFGNNEYECRLEAGQGERLAFAEEAALYHDGTGMHRQPLGSGHLESRLSQAADSGGAGIPGHVRSALRSWQVYHFHDTGDRAPLREPCDIGDNAFLRPDGSNLAAFLYRLRETERQCYDNVVDTVRLVAPFFRDFSLRPMPAQPERIQLEWEEGASNAYFNAHALSDGTLRFICLATLLLQPRSTLPTAIILDEPDLGLQSLCVGDSG